MGIKINISPLFYFDSYNLFNKRKAIRITNGFSFILNLDFLILERLFRSTHTLISTSTPLGNSSFIKASTVFEFEL